MAGTSETRARFVRLTHRAMDLRSFLEAADRTLASAVAFDSSCWLSLDPATLLPTSHYTHEVGSDHLLELAANEFLEDDYNKFAMLARADQPVAILSEATSQNLSASGRYLRILAPRGYGTGDELRAVFRAGRSAWGCVALHRRSGHFKPDDASTVATVADYIGEGIRRAIILATSEGGMQSEEIGLLILDSNDTVQDVNDTARVWLGDLVDSTVASGGPPLIVVSLANMARSAAAGVTRDIARARVPRGGGGWLHLHATTMDDAGKVALVIEPAREPTMALLMLEAYRLTRREREVAQLVLHGLSTSEIAERLHISPYTVQDHLKAIFRKTGVRSRRELVAHLFLRHYRPKLEACLPLTATGAFAQ